MKFTLLLLGIIWPCIGFSAVKITINETVYHYDGNPRLSEVLEPIAVDKAWFWPSSGLYRLNKGYIQTLKEEVLVNIQGTYGSNDDTQGTRLLEDQIRNWNLADRVFIPIDFDLARSQAKFNPMFEDGEYLLVLKERPITVSLIGMLKGPKIVKFDSGFSVSDYLTNIVGFKNTEISYVYIIQGNGDMKKSGIAYWNNTHDQVMPGGQVFIPISESQFSQKNTLLNEKIARLAANRILN
jgi:hypothetical protein